MLVAEIAEFGDHVAFGERGIYVCNHCVCVMVMILRLSGRTQ